MAKPDYTLAGVCEGLLMNLAMVSGQNDPQSKRTPTGYYDYLRSDFSKQGAESIPVDNGDGSTRYVRLKWMPRALDGGLVTDKTGFDCDGAGCSEPSFFEKMVEVDRYRGTCIRIKEDEIRTLCESPSEYSRMAIQTEFNKLARGINEDLLTLQVANFGLNVQQGDNLVRPLDMIDGASGSLIPNAWTTLMNDYQQNEQMGIPAIIGASNAARVNILKGVACCNDGGVDIAALTTQWNYGFFRDHQVDTIVGANELVMVAPGSVHYATYLEYKGERAGQFGSAMRGTIVDPFNGAEYDMKMKFNECSDEVIVEIGVHYTLCFLPVDAYFDGDPLRSGSDYVNGTFRYRFDETTP